MIVYGTRMYGKTDVVPGMLHVATQFAHVWFIPICPVESYVVVGKTRSGWHVAKIRFSFKSMLLAWARAACWLTLFVSAVMALALESTNDGVSWEVWAAGAAAAVAVVASYWWRPLIRASSARAHELALQTNMTEEARIRIDQLYGVITEEEARQAIDDLRVLDAAYSYGAQQQDPGELTTSG
jgi:hypothetical protein